MNIVVLGGGYGGLKIVSKLIRKWLPEDVTITLIDRLPYHSLKTEYYALVAGTASDKEVRFHFPSHKKLTKIYDEITGIDQEKKCVYTRENGDIAYDYVIIGLGCEDNYHNVEGAETYTHSIQTIKKARETYEAISTMDAYERVTVVGAGLTGVELVSELKESREDLDIRLLDRGKKVLRSFPEKIQNYVESWLYANDIKILRESKIEYVNKGEVCNNGVCIASDAIIWTAGVCPNKLVRQLDIEKDASGKVILNAYHQVPTDESMFVVGDCASLDFPPSAQLANIQGEQIAGILWKLMNGKQPHKPKPLRTKGTMGSLGKRDGFGSFFQRPLTGSVARTLKSGILWNHKLRG